MWEFYEIQILLFINKILLAYSHAQQQMWAAVIETLWTVKLNLFIIWSLTEVCLSLI